MMIFLIVLITALVVFSAFLSADVLYNKEQQGLKKITKTGWWVLVVDVAIIVLSLIQYHTSQIAEDARDDSLRRTYTRSVEKISFNIKSSSDSSTLLLKTASDRSTIALKNKYDSSSSNIIRALAKYGLKYDSSKNAIEKLAKISASPDPVFQLNEVKRDSSKNEYSLNFKSSDASSRNFEIKIYGLVEWNGDIFKYQPIFSALSKNNILSKDEGSKTSFKFKIPFKYLYIWLKGKYSNYDESKTYPIDEIYEYDYENKITSLPFDARELMIREKFNSYILNK